MAETPLRARARRGGADGRRDGVRPLLRHGHDRPGARRGRRVGLGRRDLRGVRRLRDRERRARTGSRTRGSSRATSGQSLEELAENGRAARRRRRRPAARGPRGQGAPSHRARSGRRGSSTSRATRRRSPPTSRCSATSSGTSSCAARRSTCSRTRRTSRACQLLTACSRASAEEHDAGVRGNQPDRHTTRRKVTM